MQLCPELQERDLALVEAPGVVEDPGEPAGRGLHEPPCFPHTVDR